MTRVLGLDIGERRIGFAFGNVMSVGSSMVVPGGFLLIHHDADVLEQVKGLVEEEQPDTLVIGVPLRDGAETKQSEKIRRLAGLIQEALPEMPIHFWDESLTSFSAGRSLAQAELKHSGQSKKGRVDAVAASLIVQGFMDSRRGYAAGLG
jgi:putative Holliday junction resolvase